MKATTMAEMAANGQMPEILFWVGCAGSFDQRAQKITKAFTLILERAGIQFAILGNEENCTGDPARRAGNELLFQMMAYNNIQVLNGYGIKKIVTTCPHCFNTLKNEYPELGGHYQVIHHTQLLQELLRVGKIKIKADGISKGEKITYHDSCYLGRANGIYEAPREVLHALHAELREMKSCRSKGLCCGAGGAQMWKEEEKGNIRVNEKRIGQAVSTGADIVVSNCPFCMTMLSDGIKTKGREDTMRVKDIAELVAESMQENQTG